MKTSIFKTPRRGLMGNKPLGADYMPEVIERARRLSAATSIRPEKQQTDNHQLRLPGFTTYGPHSARVRKTIER